MILAHLLAKMSLIFQKHKFTPQRIPRQAEGTPEDDQREPKAPKDGQMELKASTGRQRELKGSGCGEGGV